MRVVLLPQGSGVGEGPGHSQRRCREHGGKPQDRLNVAESVSDSGVGAGLLWLPCTASSHSTQGLEQGMAVPLCMSAPGNPGCWGMRSWRWE